MKKIATILTMALIFSVCSTTVISAKNMNGRNCPNGNGCGKGYVDADGDGVCDNRTYAIKYKMNGGKNNKKNPSSYRSAAKTIKLKNPTRKGYTFKGWYADKQYADTVRRLCMIHLKSYHDSEDIFQNVFLKYVLSSVKFENEEHEK